MCKMAILRRLAGGLALIATMGILPAMAADDGVVLVTVNGEEVTAADLDAELIQSHQQMAAPDRQSYDYRRLLDKIVNDRLMAQDARGMGLAAEARVAARLDQKLRYLAMKSYVDTHFEWPETVSDDAVRAYFDELYFKVQLRQVSVRTLEEARDVLAAIRAGAAMDSIAQTISLDTKKNRGGLHNLMYWADVENVLRQPAEKLAVGQLSEPFPLHDAFSIVRLEERTPVDWDAFAKFEPQIRSYLVSEARNAAWSAFVEKLRRRYPVDIDPGILAEIRADSTKVLTGLFLNESDRPMLAVGQEHRVSESDVRKAISHRAMTAGTSTFASMLKEGLDEKIEGLVLEAAAKEAGAFEDPGVRAKFASEEARILVEGYLEELIVPRIVFNREEFQKFYDEHPEQFRGADRYLLDTMVLDDEATAKEYEERLREGADFTYLQSQQGHAPAAQNDDWIVIDALSPEVKDALQNLSAGQTTPALSIPSGWVIFRVRDKKPGPLQTLEEADLRIREVMFQKKFNALLDEHLAGLKARSQIVRNESAIGSYFKGS